MAPRDAAAYARLRAWQATGRTATLIRPLARVASRLREHGYTVYGIGDDGHLLADPPEDHTPYSRTGYPIAATYGRLYAIDVMPVTPGTRSKLDGQPLPSIQELGAQLHADRLVGMTATIWLKYMNWEPEGDYRGPCYHDAWTGGYYRSASGDRGHLHLSAYTAMDESPIADDYDLVARTRNPDDDQEDELSARASQLIEAMSRRSGTNGLPAVPEKDSPFQKIEQIFDTQRAQQRQLDEIQRQLGQVLAVLAAQE